LASRNPGEWRWIGVAVVFVLLTVAAHARGPQTRPRANHQAALQQTSWALAHLDGPSLNDRRIAALYLLESGRRADLVDRLLTLAVAGDARAADQLACVMQERDRQRVRDLMHGSRPRVRVPLLRLLRPVANRHDVHRFVQALDHADAGVRAAAVRALTGPEPRDPRLVAGLAELVHDPVLHHRDVEDDVLLREVRASREVSARATELLSDPSPEVRAAAAELVAVLSR
jgi:hypothetical protein